MAYALFREIEKAKIELSETELSQFQFSYVDIDVREKIDRYEFVENSDHVTQSIMKSLDHCIGNAGLSHYNIDIVCLTGGTSLLPAINQQLVQRFGERLASSSRFDAVVHGLAQRGLQIIEGK